ncbi:MAG: protein kinase [Peptococcaceae bacterium]|nr:protein kinase [Peptococcaceae bacterium]
MEKFAEDLSKILDSTEEDNLYEVLEVLKDGDCSRVEKVRKDGSVYVRKYYQEEQYTIHDLSRLTHAALPHMYGSYQLAGKIALIEEYIEGVTLHDYVKQNKELSLKEAVTLTLELCEVVSYLHGQNPPIIHRDIKPSNIMRTSSGIKLIDFNIARSYNPGKERDTVYMGTVGYAPPEQFGFGQTDMRSDIFSIGKTFLYMLTGSQPERHVDTATLGTLPDSVQRIIYLSTNFTPQFRYSSVDDMIKDLRSTGDTVINCESATQGPGPSAPDPDIPIQSGPEQQNLGLTDSEETPGDAFSLQNTNETDLLCSRSLPPEKTGCDGAFLSKEDVVEDVEEDVPKGFIEKNGVEVAPPLSPDENTLISFPAQSSDIGQIRKLIILLAAACCVLLTIGLGTFFILDGQGPANALAEAASQVMEPDPDAELESGSGLEPESEPEEESNDDTESNPESMPIPTPGADAGTNTEPKSDIKTKPDGNTTQLPAPAIEIVSAKPDKNTYHLTDPSVWLPSNGITYTIKTNVPADKLEIQEGYTGNTNTTTYFVYSDRTISRQPSVWSCKISTDKLSWEFGLFAWQYTGTVKVTISAYDSTGKKSAPVSFTIYVQQSVNLSL